MQVSIIIATRNRAPAFKETLASLDRMTVPEDWEIELVLVDNGSVDETPSVLDAFQPRSLSVQRLRVEEKGKSRALNAGLRVARGEAFLFTDDDVRVPKDWALKMAEPILGGEVDALQGGVTLAPGLLKPWMTDYERASLAEVPPPRPGQRVVLIGANMAISKKVFAVVRGFDPEIGPGISVGGEDTLFSFQVEAAGFRMGWKTEVAVEHHFDARRLTRKEAVRAAKLGAISDFHIAHHWFHQDEKNRLWRVVRSWLRLQYHRARRWKELRKHPTAPAWERVMIQQHHCARQFLWRANSPRSYPARLSSMRFEERQEPADEVGIPQGAGKS